jgi:malonate decarboxylase alpha subunit
VKLRPRGATWVEGRPSARSPEYIPFFFAYANEANNALPTTIGVYDMADWHAERRARDERLAAGSKFSTGKMVAPKDVTGLLEALVRPGDRICLEGDNQKQADFLAACLANADPKVLHDLHVVQSGIVLPEHIDLFEKGIAKKLDFSFSGPQSHAIPRVLKSGNVELGAIHTYIELFARYFVDLTPHVALTVARSADREGGFPVRHRGDGLQGWHCRRASQ